MLESSQKDKSRAQSADSSIAHRKPSRAFKHAKANENTMA